IRVDGIPPPAQNALLYETVTVVEGKPILRDMVFSPYHQYIYLLSDRQVRTPAEGPPDGLQYEEDSESNMNSTARLQTTAQTNPGSHLRSFELSNMSQKNPTFAAAATTASMFCSEEVQQLSFPVQPPPNKHTPTPWFCSLLEVPSLENMEIIE
ncbi:hypothetical protein AMECASPLE_032648, partial [Ameca splendens]